MSVYYLFHRFFYLFKLIKYMYIFFINIHNTYVCNMYIIYMYIVLCCDSDQTDGNQFWNKYVWRFKVYTNIVLFIFPLPRYKQKLIASKKASILQYKISFALRRDMNFVLRLLILFFFTYIFQNRGCQSAVVVVTAVRAEEARTHTTYSAMQR